MGTHRVFNSLAALVVLIFSEEARAQTPGIGMAIEKHAILMNTGVMIFRVRILCGPFAGTEDFQAGFAGGSQERTGAVSESGIDGTVTCDGVERTHTVHLTPFDRPFKHGPANANASLILCMLVGDEQQCFSGRAARPLIIRGGSFR